MTETFWGRKILLHPLFVPNKKNNKKENMSMSMRMGEEVSTEKNERNHTVERLYSQFATMQWIDILNDPK